LRGEILAKERKERRGRSRRRASVVHNDRGSRRAHLRGPGFLFSYGNEATQISLVATNRLDLALRHDGVKLLGWETQERFVSKNKKRLKIF
jgi:hypothetical protein